MANLKIQVDYKKRRRESYPPLGDQLDAIWKILATLPQKKWPAEAVAVLGQVQAVKAVIPKPAQPEADPE